MIERARAENLVAELVRIEGVRRWRTEAFGGEIVAALGPA